MSKATEQPGSGSGPANSTFRRRPVILPAVVVAVVVIGAAIAFKSLRSPAPPPAPSPEGAPQALQPPAHVVPRPIASTSEPVSAAPATPPAASVQGSAPSTEIPADPKQLLSSLAMLDGKEPITPDQAQRWKQSLQQLIHQGAASVPAIQQLLAQNQDVNYAGVSGAGQLGYSSLRGALLDALGQIGGPEATAAMLQTLQTSVYPTDIAAIAKTLEASAPGQYSGDVLNAVRLQLSLAAMDQLGSANVGPLFQLLAGANASGADVAADLAQYSGKWPYYASIALAGLPDNAGVPALIQMAQGAIGSNQAAAAQALAQIAPQNADALNTLIDLAKNDKLPDSILAQLAPFLGGRQYLLGLPADGVTPGYLTFHLANGNQDFAAYDTGNTLTAAQITQRISIIDQLLQAIPSTDSAAQDALQQQRAALAAKAK
jgi:hypothetical protein